MNSRERVLAAFDKVPADRVPINYMSNPLLDLRLKKHYGLDNNDYEGLFKKLHVDFRGIGAGYKGKKLHDDIEDRKVDPLWGIRRRWVENPSGGYWDYCDFPLKEADEEMIGKWPMPDPDDFDYSTVEDSCKKNEEFAQFIMCYGDLINGNGMLRGMEQTLIDLLTDEPAGLLLAKRRFEIQAGIAERVLDAANGRIDFVWLGEDLGTQDRQMISLDVFRRNIKPYYQILVDMATSYGAKTMIHTCGSSSWAYEDFIDMGIDAVDTLQPECKNMSPSYLVEHFGGRLSFHGCISTAGSLAYGTVEDIRREVKDILEIMMPTYSYMLSPTHMIQDNTPVENAVAMYEAAMEYGWYRE